MGDVSLPEDLASTVQAVGNAVSPDDVDTYGRLRRIEDQSFRLRALVDAWERQQTQERSLRKHYAKWLLRALFAQIVLIDAAFFLLGFGVIEVEKWVATTFIVAAFGELAGMSAIVVKYLFPKVGSEVIERIGESQADGSSGGGRGHV